MSRFQHLEWPQAGEPFNIAEILSFLAHSRTASNTGMKHVERPQPEESVDMDDVFGFLRLTNVDPNNRFPLTGPPQHQATTGFLDLPVEIRSAIYELVLPSESPYQYKSIGVYGLPVPIPPPIARVCRAMREESLRCWYTTVRFPIHFRITSWYDTPMGMQGTPNYDMVSAGNESVYPCLRKLRLCLDHRPSTMLNISPAYLCFDVDLDRKSNSYSIMHSPRTAPRWTGPPPFDTKGDRQTQKTVKRLLKQFDKAMAETIAKSGGIGNITFKDYTHLTPQPSWMFWRDIPDDDD